MQEIGGKENAFLCKGGQKASRAGALSSCGVTFHDPHKPALVDVALSSLAAR